MFIHTVFDLFKSTSIIFVSASLTASILKSGQTALHTVLCVTTVAKAFGNERNFSVMQSVVPVTLVHICSALWVCFSVPVRPALYTRLKI